MTVEPSDDSVVGVSAEVSIIMSGSEFGQRAVAGDVVAVKSGEVVAAGLSDESAAPQLLGGGDGEKTCIDFVYLYSRCGRSLSVAT